MQYLSASTHINNIVIGFLTTAPPGFLSSFFSSLLSTNFVKLFLESPYLVFLLAGVFGWLAKLAFFRLESGKPFFSQD